MSVLKEGIEMEERGERARVNSFTSLSRQIKQLIYQPCKINTAAISACIALLILPVTRRWVMDGADKTGFWGLNVFLSSVMFLSLPTSFLILCESLQLHLDA